VNTVLPVISGGGTVGQPLSVTSGAWNNGPTAYGYQWLRNGVAIGGASSSVYTLVTADIGFLITCQVTASNAAGSALATSLPVGPVAAAPPEGALLRQGGGYILKQDGGYIVLQQAGWIALQGGGFLLQQSGGFFSRQTNPAPAGTVQDPAGGALIDPSGAYVLEP
jgi:hypothetical protein